ncbi:MAG TPA: pyruvate dehydrogenase complex dihydrolipoamide acetyltransferase [Pyrinomonadaceae bacterium]|nr:pyruvate dehydrogenase complex dihydrolipoamide acetyltransferase [Chloracidobacterium sp.]MBP9936175.1 pyruvate dehydrogenase complex dihydrolipoamide acetyltransferase [Pyrinomonadaceae bacterium]MBK9438886.1 pyruvate dehydrogenase complex dihydrolipoamide acetyltransferase [Chloracidobacterium sp.]MBL0240417.1 pyruvate dehydrogenase complex dihydrolipoamide acetyltransferase [Chloracidobacterium sp.]HQY68333.1 pyruvate dehydrogenase complex dihydrolipoamide acetyltransferase [Pyrinomonada
MAENFLMPKLSPTMDEGQIARWVKNEGDSYEANETLAEVDTDKATMEMTALKAGTLLKIIKKAGDTAKLGEPIAIIGAKGDDISALLAASSAPAKSETPASAGAQKVEEKVPAASLPTPEDQKPKAEAASTGRLIVSPIAARMAAENGVDLKTINGSGPNGRIIKRDIEQAMSGGGAKPASKTFTASTVVGASAYTDEPTSKMRQIIATRLAESIGPIPTFYLTTEIEMDNAVALRKAVNASVSEAEKISLNDIVVKASAMALVKHPFVNASYQDTNIRFYEQADIGVAVAIDEGLITPVIRGANLKGFLEIAAEIKDLAAKAKAKKLQPEEYTGATFSISNLGMFGIKEFTAIINPPEAGILAVGGAAEVPVVRDGQIVIRNIMNVTMSCDHRVIDGATGAKFLQTFKQMLENPGMMSA